MNSRIISIYRYGSRVYGTHEPWSDHDLLVVVSNKGSGNPVPETVEIYRERMGLRSRINADVHIHTEEEFVSGLAGFKPFFIECANDKAEDGLGTLIYGKLHPMPKMDESIIKREFEANARETWRKAERLMSSGDKLKSLKTAWHAERVRRFGEALIRHGTIARPGCANDLFEKIMGYSDLNEVESELRSSGNTTLIGLKG